MHHEGNTPLIRLAKRDGMPRGQVWAIRGASFLLAIVIGALIFLLLGHSPFAAYGAILEGSLGRPTMLRQTVRIAVPLLGTALAIAPCFKMRFWNIGAEGQITAGAVGASYFALFWADKLPAPVLLVVMALSGALSGLVGFIVVSGADGTLHAEVAAGVGFTAITVAWLAQLNPFGMVAISGLLAVLEKGADRLQTNMDVPASISDIITGVFLFCILGSEFFINYRLILGRGRQGKEAADNG